jgi:hypothetical protein
VIGARAPWDPSAQAAGARYRRAYLRPLRGTCNQHLCCNPTHLAAGTPAKDSADILISRDTGYRVHRRRLVEVT